MQYCVLIQTCLRSISHGFLLIGKPLLFYVGIPNNMVALRATGKKKPRLHGSLVSLAEYGTFGVEFLTLSDRTGNATYANSAEAVYRSVSAILPPPPPLPPSPAGAAYHISHAVSSSSSIACRACGGTCELMSQCQVSLLSCSNGWRFGWRSVYQVK